MTGPTLGDLEREAATLVPREQVEAIDLWSVTTLIKAGLGLSDGIVGWAVRVTAERAYDKFPILGAYREEDDRDGAIKWLTDARWEATKEAQSRGTAVHSMLEGYALGKVIEAHARGEQPEIPDALLPYDEQLRRFLSDFRPRFLMAEAPVYNLTHRYAGTLDAILELDGVPFVVDAKTTAKLPDARSRPPYSEIALQLVAYRRAEMVGVSPATMRERNRRRYYVYDPQLGYEPMPETAGGLALIVSPVDYRLIPIRTDEEVWRAFGFVRQTARWQLDTSRRVIGPVVEPPGKRA